jgi:hypothetical protein
MFGLGVTVLEVAATEVLAAVGASAIVAISTALTPSLVINADVRSVPDIKALEIYWLLSSWRETRRC